MQCINQIKAMLINGPADLREQTRTLPTRQLVGALGRPRPGTDLADPTTATKIALSGSPPHCLDPGDQ
jgi:transposase